MKQRHQRKLFITLCVTVLISMTTLLYGPVFGQPASKEWPVVSWFRKTFVPAYVETSEKQLTVTCDPTLPATSTKCTATGYKVPPGVIIRTEYPITVTQPDTYPLCDSFWTAPTNMPCYVDISVVATVDNGAAATDLQRWHFTADQPPTANVTAPSNDSTLSGVVTVTANASDDVGVTVSYLIVDDAVWSSDSDSPYSFVMDTRGLSEGRHFLYIRAWDGSSNAGDSARINFTVQNVVPTPTPTPTPTATPTPTPSPTPTATPTPRPTPCVRTLPNGKTKPCR